MLALLKIAPLAMSLFSLASLADAAPLANTIFSKRGEMNGYQELSKADADACKLKGPVDGGEFVWGPAIFGTEDGHGTYDRGEFHGYGAGNNECVTHCLEKPHSAG